MALLFPNPNTVYPIPEVKRLVLLKPLIDDPRIIAGDYTYYDDPEHAVDFVERNVLYHFGPERLVLGKFCAIACGTRFLMAGSEHPRMGVSTFPFTIFGGTWEQRTADLMSSMSTRGDTIIGNDVWIGMNASILPGVTIGDGAIIGAGSVVSSNVAPYTIVAGNPARHIRNRFAPDAIRRLLQAAWWDWPPSLITQHVRLIMAGSADQIRQVAADNNLLQPAVPVSKY